MLAPRATLLDLFLVEEMVYHVLKNSVIVSFFADLRLVNVQEDMIVQSRGDMTLLTFELSIGHHSETSHNDF